MNVSLGEFQDAFVGALRGTEPTPANPAAEWLATISAQPGFAVYRNTVMKGCVDALRANFPTVERLVGADWMAAAAAVYARQWPPTQTQLIDYGAGFADFLQGFEPARELPYLAEVARLDRLWIAAFAAPEQSRLELHVLGSMVPTQLAELYLRPCAAARWHWSALPAFTLWRCNRECVDLPDPLSWQGEGVLLFRQQNRITWQPLSRGGCVFLDACADGRTLAGASALAIEAEPALDFNDLLMRLFAAGVFTTD